MDECGVMNYYKCPNCGTSWHDEWNCACNDRCPTCNSEIEPHTSYDTQTQEEL